MRSTLGLKGAFVRRPSSGYAHGSRRLPLTRAQLMRTAVTRPWTPSALAPRLGDRIAPGYIRIVKHRQRNRTAHLARPLLVLDVETTGLDPSADAIVQLAAVILDAQTLAERRAFSTLVRTAKPISDSAYDVHGLGLKDLETAPELPAALSQFREFADSSAIICGHNVGFDYAFLKNGYLQLGWTFPFDYHTLDIWSLAFFILGADGIQLPKYDLDHLCGLYGIPRAAHHDALQDVRASSQILRQLFAAVAARDLEALGQLHLFA